MSFSKALSKFKFSNPAVNEIAVLCAEDYWVQRLVIRDLPSTTLAFHPTRIYLTPALIVRTLLRLRMIDWSKINRQSFLKDLFRQIYAQHALACLDQIGAKVVVTWLDNSPFFHNLTQIDRTRTYFSIQNGTRTLACVRDSLPPPPHPASRITMTNFFCFGARDIDLFSRHGHKIDNFLTVGSLLGSYYRSTVTPPAEKPKFDLCLISQWHAHIFDEINGDDYHADSSRRIAAGVKAMNAFLLRLIEETGLKLVVCPRSDADHAEISFYKDFFGDKVTIATSDRLNFSTYRMADQSRLVTGLNSTTLAEVFAWGKKVLWCNVNEDEHYEMPEAGISYFHGDDYDAFKQRVLMLLEMPDAEFARQTKDDARYINNFDPANPPHEIIRAAIMQARLDSPQSAAIRSNPQ
jgi:surface carbohydrate biosynthesis protein